MKKLYLGGAKGSVIGNYAIVDDDVYEWASKRGWCVHGEGYACGRSKGKLELLHRLIMKPTKNKMVDHQDGNRLNNLRSNLRICTNAQNLSNRPKQKNNTSGFKGVTWHGQRKKWVARIEHKKKRIHIGLYSILQEAANAYNEKAKELQGEYAFNH